MLAALALSLTLAPIETDCLFVLAHAGETNELVAVMEEMQEKGSDFYVLPLGVAKDLIRNRISPERQLDAECLGVAIAKNWPIDQELPQSSVEDVAKMIHAKLVVTGVAMMPQKQFLEAYRPTARTVAYWDNPEPRGAVPYFTTALKVQAAAEKVLFPSGFVSSAKEFADRPDEQKIVAGKPTLLLSLKDLHQIDRSAVLKKLGFVDKEPIIAFIGTYGDRYEKAFELFVKSLATFPNPKPQVIFQIHPMASGDFEQKCCAPLSKCVLSPRDPKHGVAMLEAIAAADVVVTYNSSAGFQALLGGKRVLYVVPEGDAYSNSLIEQGVALKADSIEAITREYLRKDLSSAKVDLLQTMQIPLDPKERLLHFIQAN